MALDRQKILNELGSVVNQLQSADCGCMGKLFSNSGQENYNPGHMAGHNGGYNMRNYYGHGQGYNSPCAGEPCAGAHRCMGSCESPKLYSDTYNYLNRNLMQPVVQEVYQDLKSITPDNTIMNSPMGAQMGMAPTNKPNQLNLNQNSMQGGHLGNQNVNGHAHVPHVHFGNMSVDNPNSQAMGQMGQSMEQTGYNHGGHGFGQMGQMGQEHGMGMVGQEYGNVQMGQEQEVSHGHGQVGNGMGQMGQGIGHIGQGMGTMGHGMGQVGYGMDQVGHGMGQMGYGMGQMGQSMEQTGQGIDQMGQGVGQIGQDMGQMGQGMGQMEQGMVQRVQGAGQMNHGMGHSGTMGDMGQQIMRMMSSNAKRNKVPIVDNLPPNTPVNTPHSGDTRHMVNEVNQGQYHSGQMQGHVGYIQPDNMQQGRPEMQTSQYISQQNVFPSAAGNAQGDQMHGHMNQIHSSARPTGNMNAKHLDNHAAYGKHSAGISKFNEMFPGVMKGDLGFDPMAIAIQMNPANQQKSAMDTMEKLMMNNNKGINKIIDSQGKASPHIQPVISATNVASANIKQPNQLRIEESGQRIPETQRNNNQMYSQQQNDQIPQRLYQPPQQMVDPNTGAIITHPPLPTIYEGSEDPTAKQPASHTGLTPCDYKEPILPADTSRNLLHSHHFHQKPPRNYEYNTIGQPVERHYQSAENPCKYSNVKQTVSKTAIVGTNPIGRTPSRSQQQVIYNQYKGSQSFTKQNIKPTTYKVSHSEPRIAPAQNTLEAPIERYNGDSAANDQVTPVDVKFPNIYAKQAAEKTFKLRNGLQDQIFSASPTSAKWSFHGNNNVVPYSVGYRFRTK